MTLEQPFNYHELPEGFLKWLVLALVSSHGDPYDPTVLNAFIATDVTAVTITMQINGIEVDAMYLLDRLEQARDWYIKQTVKEELQEKLRLTAYDTFCEIFRDGVSHIKKQLKEAGVDVYDQD